MSKIIFSFLLINLLVLSYSCKSDLDVDATEQNILPSELEDITIEDLENYLPDGLKNNSKVVYINEAGEEWKLTTDYEKITRERDEVDFSINYEHEQFQAVLVDELREFKIRISGFGLYTKNLDVQKFISVDLMPFTEGGSAFINVLFENGEPIIDEFSVFDSEIEIYGKTFIDVFSGSDTLAEAYNEISINKEVGIVSFRDENKELWVFERFEE